MMNRDEAFEVFRVNVFPTSAIIVTLPQAMAKIDKIELKLEIGTFLLTSPCTGSLSFSTG